MVEGARSGKRLLCPAAITAGELLLFPQGLGAYGGLETGWGSRKKAKRKKKEIKLKKIKKPKEGRA